jgi:hypothetical protein
MTGMNTQIWEPRCQHCSRVAAPNRASCSQCLTRRNQWWKVRKARQPWRPAHGPQVGCCGRWWTITQVPLRVSCCGRVFFAQDGL